MMTIEQKRIKLAEAAGWQLHPKDRFIVIPPNSPHSVQSLSTIPNYFNDLNAVHELEKVLKLHQFWSYADLLSVMVDTSRGKDSYISATATQRAEAIGLTLNLW
jgi:hypothetical protein